MFLKQKYKYFLQQGNLMKSFELMSSELHRKDNGLETLRNNLHHHYKALYHNNTSLLCFYKLQGFLKQIQKKKYL